MILRHRKCLVLFVSLWTLAFAETDASDAPLSRRGFLVYGGTAVVAPLMADSSCTDILAPSSQVVQITRAEALTSAVVVARYETQLMTGAYAAQHLADRFYLQSPEISGPHDPKRHGVRPTEEYRVITNEAHPLRTILSRVYGQLNPDPGSEGSGYQPAWYHRFDSGDLPAWLMVKLKSWSKSIVIVQETLSQRLNIPLDRIEFEMQYIYEPHKNRAVWITKNKDGPEDPCPESLGLGFHQAFYAELKALEPDLAVELEESEARAMKQAYYQGREHRFSATGPLGAYIRKTGRRMTLTLEEFNELERQLIKLVRESKKDSIQDEVFSADSDLSALQLRQLLKWLVAIRSPSPSVTATPSAVAVLDSSVPILNSPAAAELQLSAPEDVGPLPVVLPVSTVDLSLELRSDPEMQNIRTEESK